MYAYKYATPYTLLILFAIYLTHPWKTVSDYRLFSIYLFYIYISIYILINIFEWHHKAAFVLSKITAKYSEKLLQSKIAVCFLHLV